MCQNQDGYSVTVVLTETKPRTSVSAAPGVYLLVVQVFFPFNALRKVLGTNGLAYKEDRSTETLTVCDCNLPSVYIALEIFFLLYCKLHTKQG